MKNLLKRLLRLKNLLKMKFISSLMKLYRLSFNMESIFFIVMVLLFFEDFFDIK
jgi:hypothetical protein